MRFRTALAVSVAAAALSVSGAAAALPVAAPEATSTAARSAVPLPARAAALPVVPRSASAAAPPAASLLTPDALPDGPLPTPVAAAPHGVGEGGGARPAPALPARVQPDCGDGRSGEFPLGARIRGGPAVYRTGGGPQSWYLDLTNATDRACAAVHPVVVFSDRAHALEPAQFRMEFTAGGAAYPVTLEQSDQDEIIAVFDGAGSFPGFTVAANGSVTVPVRLAFAEDTPPGEVVADAALVQRKGDDGDWVGESGGYRFAVEGAEEPVEPGAAGSLAQTGRPGRLYGLGALAAAGAGTGAALLLGARRLRRT
ncbi:hypothetical protein LG634_24165 [Streptomyces bambusae]|uniref:hypothetical protein n=1 Tax=Streptomyces bambusae TaxID=1550616 RepID=UPI001CFE7CC1|nr:hypothetical protein [Streptomyces bambusae]MCB5167911.1 hypothetical protein [Streptomyces bambusae]